MLMLLQNHPLQDQITDLLNNWPSQLLSATLAIGFLTMTVITYYKSFIRIRFHARRLADWLKLSPTQLDAIRETARKHYDEIPEQEKVYPYDADFAAPGGIETLLKLTIAGDGRALYSLGIANLSGQLALGTQALLERPKRHPILLAELIGKEIKSDEMQDDYWTVVSYRYNFYFRSPDQPTDADYYPQVQAERMNYSRNRISAHIQRRIDAFQIRTAYLWKKRMRLVSFAVAISISLAGSFLFAESGHFFGILIAALIIGYLGAFLAGLFHDIIAVIRSHKK
ncbi:hypothetical protein GCM10022289_45170 [Pedobacter jeongneungensis]|uniref:DUF4231 domain-containing protein n=2 Tax=Pedobacter jeongneungensis TaxID=947309 RepID=A0ABP8BQU6_9SPHI